MRHFENATNVWSGEKSCGARSGVSSVRGFVCHQRALHGLRRKTKRSLKHRLHGVRAGNDFFPNLEAAKDADIIFFCSPNNPTGAAATRAQCKELVDFANKNGQIVIYDAAYAFTSKIRIVRRRFTKLKGSETCCIELLVLQVRRIHGFAIRLDGRSGSVEVCGRFFSQIRLEQVHVHGLQPRCLQRRARRRLKALSDEGWKSMQETVGFYKENAKMLKKTFEELGFKVLWANAIAHYVWVDFDGRDSWEVFTEILTKTDIVTTPGAGFGPTGDGFVRMSAFCHRDNGNCD